MKIRRNSMHFLSQWGRFSKCAMAPCWLIGLLLGFCAAECAAFSLVQIVPYYAFGRVSLVQLLAACVLPFVVTYISAYLNAYWLACILSLWKAFSFGYCAVGIGLAYGSAGWLMRSLLLFSDGMILPALLFYWLYFARKGKAVGKMAVILAIYAAGIAVFDYCFITPLLHAVLF